MATMKVSLPANLAEFVEREITSGGYALQSEVVRDALRLLHREKAAEQEKLAILRGTVTVGIEDWEKGRVDDRAIDDILNEVDRDITWRYLVRGCKAGFPNRPQGDR